MARASTRLDGITAPVEIGFSIHERMNCISSSRRRLFFSTRAIEGDGMLRGHALRAAGLAATSTGIGTKAGGQDGLPRLAAPASETVKKLFDSTEETGRFRLSLLGRQLFELGQQLALAFSQVLRRLHRYLNVHVASLFRTQHRHTLARAAGSGGRSASPAGTLTLALLPSIAGTSNSPPSAALAMEIGTRQCRSAPSRWKNSCGATSRKI